MLRYVAPLAALAMVASPALAHTKKVETHKVAKVHKTKTAKMAKPKAAKAS